ncbi:hypothetical protein N6H14_13510 [Paenibacillus sp. CC-CFT747]|nr:hypothetical protein N6H14_13510 [Paenibacillus sp. CC-CFT747]
MRAAFFRNHSIRWQLIAVGTAILLFMFAAGVWGYNEILNITFKRNSEYTTEILATIRHNISSNADSINRILPNIAYNEQVQEYLLEDDRLRQYEMYNKIEKLLVNLQSMKQGILGVVLVGRGTSSYNCVGCRDYIPFPEIPERTSSYYTGVQYSPITRITSCTWAFRFTTTGKRPRSSKKSDMRLWRSVLMPSFRL